MAILLNITDSFCKIPAPSLSVAGFNVTADIPSPVRSLRGGKTVRPDPEEQKEQTRMQVLWLKAC